jgi:hypothetical protein
VIIIFYNFRYNQLLLSSFFRNLGTTIPIRVHCFTFSHDNSFLHCNTSPIICNNMSFLTLERLLAINRIDQTSSWLLLYSSNSVMTLMFIPCPAFCTTRAIFFKSVHIKTLKCTPFGYAANDNYLVSKKINRSMLFYIYRLIITGIFFSDMNVPLSCL